MTRARAALLPVLLIACEVPEGEEDDVASLEAAVVVPQTPVQSLAVPNWKTRVDHVEFVNAAAYAHDLYRERYVVASRRKGSPYQLEYFLIDGKKGNATYGQAVTSILQPTCVGSSPCSAINLYGGTTWPQGTSSSKGVVLYTSDHFDDDPNDPQNPSSGDALMRASIWTASGAHSFQTLHDCRNFGATIVPPDCKIRAVSHASSTRKDGTDKVLVAYLIMNDITLNDWRLATILFTPGGAQVNLPQIKYCSEPACQQGNFYILQSETAYNALEDKFLVVFAVWPTAPVVRAYGQIYDGTTGAAVGAPIDLGPIGNTTNHFPIDQQYIGVASSPNAVDNPGHEWVVFLDDKRYDVAPNGSFTASALSSGVETGNWTLQWTSPADGREYERFTDYGPGSKASSERYLESPAAPQIGAVATSGDTFAEQLAHRLGSGNALALWSGLNCFAGIPCMGGLQWRIIDH